MRRGGSGGGLDEEEWLRYEVRQMCWLESVRVWK